MFPPEIIDHDLSFLQRDHATLKVCARAHPLLSSLVKKHFYCNLTVQNHDPCPAGTYRPLDLLKLIVDDPNIASHVRSLQVITLGNFWEETELLAPILATVTRLQTTILVPTTEIVWNDLCESFRTAFSNSLRLPTLTHVQLACFDNFPLSALDHSSSLKWLSLWGDFSYLPPSTPLVYPPLDFLDLRNCSSGSMEIITSWVESRSLPVRSLKLVLGRGLHQRLLGVCANTLTTLTVDFQFYCFTDIPLSLSCLSHLAQLTVQSTVTYHSSCLPAVMCFLDTLPSPPTSLVLLIISHDIFIGNGFDIRDTDWSPLISFPYFDDIPSIELRVNVPDVHSQTPLVELLKQDRHLKQLESHRSFVIKAVEDQL